MALNCVFVEVIISDHSCTHMSLSSSEQPSNYYLSSHRPSQDVGHAYDDNALLFQLSLEDGLMENTNLQKALVPFEQLVIEEEIGKGIYISKDNKDNHRFNDCTLIKTGSLN